MILNKRVLGLDYGTKRCGIAVTDPLNITAQGKENFSYQENNHEELSQKILSVIKECNIGKVVFGYPTFISGDKTNTAKLIDKFVENFRKIVDENIKIDFVEENNSTQRAKAILRESGMNEKKMKKYKDQLSAQIILEDYLQMNKE